MTPKEFKRLLANNWGKLLVVPVVTAASIYYFAGSKPKEYTSYTTIFTGINTSYKIAGDNNATSKVGTDVIFGNFYGIINSQEMKEDVALNLLAAHLMLEKSDAAVLSEINYKHLQEVVPDPLRKKLIGNSVEETLANVTSYFKSNNKNEIYHLINSDDPVYSLAALSNVSAKQKGSSEIMTLAYSSNDPAVCQNTLELYNRLFISKYKSLTSTQSESVVGYFDTATQNAHQRLQQAEQKLFAFQKAHNIIDYDQQASATSSERTAGSGRYNDLQMQYAGAVSNLRTAEQNLKNRGVSNLQAQEVLRLRNKLSDITGDITNLEMAGNNAARIASLRQQAADVSADIKETIEKYYNNTHSAQGIPIQTMLDEFVRSTVLAEQLKSQLSTLEQQNASAAGEISKLVPLGAEMRRIKREVEIADQDYRAQVEGLKQSKLTNENLELSSSQLKVLDPPIFPTAVDTTLILVIAGFLGSLILMIGGVLAFNLLDQSLTTPTITAKKTGFPIAGVLPALSGKKKTQLLTNKAEDHLVRQVLLEYNKKQVSQTPFLIGVLSAHSGEGKSLVCSTMSDKLNTLGIKTAVLYPDSHAQKVSSFDYASLYSPIHGMAQNITIADLLGNSALDYDLVFIEFPALLEKNYPVSLLKQLNFIIVTIKSGRLWQKADKAVFKNIQAITKSPIEVVLNGVISDYVEDFIGFQQSNTNVDEDNIEVLPAIEEKPRKKIAELNAE